MIALYLKAYARNFSKNSLSLSVAVFGLAVGIAAFLWSLSFISRELSFDGFHEKKSSIYRIVFGEHDAHGSAYTSFVMGSVLQQNFPDVKIARFNNAGGMRMPMRYGDKKFTETRFYFTDPQVFDVFSFRLIEGDLATALTAPFTVVLTPQVAERYFGKENPIGKA